MFEEEVAEYTGAPYAISIDSCTNALFLCCHYLRVNKVTIPKHTYLSVPQSIIHAGGTVQFEDLQWKGIYQLKPYPIYDAAKRFTSNLYLQGTYMCLSFHIKKHLKIGKGGMILCDNQAAAEWFKKARYEGRNEKMLSLDNINSMGWNMYMTPLEAAMGLMLMQNIQESNNDLDETYPDLTQFDLFK